MKIFILLFCALVSLTSQKCNSVDKKKVDKLLSIEYESHTRGSLSKAIVKKDTLIIVEVGGGNEGIYFHGLPEKDWNDLVKETSKIDVSAINQYEAPTNNSAVDAARMANIKIIYAEESYKSQRFDEGNPPIQIKKLVDRVAEIHKKNKPKK